MAINLAPPPEKNPDVNTKQWRLWLFSLYQKVKDNLYSVGTSIGDLVQLEDVGGSAGLPAVDGSQLGFTTLKSNAADTPPTIEDNAGREIIQGCWAWVNFSGTGTVTVRGSFNVSSITDSGTGRFQVNYTNNISTSNCPVSSAGENTYPSNTRDVSIINPAISSCSILCQSAGADFDPEYVTLTVFADP